MGTFLPVFAVASLAECENACDALVNPPCTGYEYNEPPLSNTQCELHTAAEDFDHTDAINGCTCFAKTLVAAAAAAAVSGTDTAQLLSSSQAESDDTNKISTLASALLATACLVVAVVAAGLVVAWRRVGTSSGTRVDRGSAVVFSTDSTALSAPQPENQPSDTDELGWSPHVDTVELEWDYTATKA